MTRLERALRRIAADLEDLGASWAVVGGLAVAVRAEPRLTRDVDVAVAVADDAAAERIVFDLQHRGYRVGATVEHKPTGRLGTARLYPPPPVSQAVFVDLLFAATGIERSIAEASQPLEIVQGLTAPVARRGHLLAMKVLAYDDRKRPMDYDDIQSLLEWGDAADVELAIESLAQIERLGFNRGKNLVEIFETLQRGYPHEIG